MNKSDLGTVFDDLNLVESLLMEIKRKVKEPLKIMEVCGTHTRSIFKYGIDKLLPEKIKLISGPGCPVCVTPGNYIDNAINLSKNPDVIIATFGDLIRVPGSNGNSLNLQRAAGARVEIIYSPLDALKIAEDNRNKNIVFLGVGFETTAPAIALMLKEAKAREINNIFVLLSLKTMPAAIERLVLDKDIKINGLICPGHVASIIGIKEFQELGKKYRIPMAVCGFQSVDILGGILTIIVDLEKAESGCKNRYSRVVKDGGNLAALKVLGEVFEEDNAWWRGIGHIEASGLKLRKEYEVFDALNKYSLKTVDEIEVNGCICGEILKGKKVPSQCRLFGVKCTPHSPIGPCMVSSEGSCGIAYDFGM